MSVLAYFLALWAVIGTAVAVLAGTFIAIGMGTHPRSRQPDRAEALRLDTEESGLVK